MTARGMLPGSLVISLPKTDPVSTGIDLKVSVKLFMAMLLGDE